MQNFIQSLNNFKNDGLSVIITAYKSQDFIEECLDSIQNQNYFKYNDNYEILVGIDACESTLEKVNEIKKKYRNLKVFYATENGGTYRMRNSLWIRAKYENLLFFDSDDVMPVDFVSNNIHYIDEYKLVRYRIMSFINGKKKQLHSLPNWYAYGSVLIKKNIMKELGGYTDKRISMDMDLCLRYFAKFSKEKLNDRTFYWYRIHQNQLTASKESGVKTEIRKNTEKYIHSRIQTKDLINKKIFCNNSITRIF